KGIKRGKGAARQGKAWFIPTLSTAVFAISGAGRARVPNEHRATRIKHARVLEGFEGVQGKEPASRHELLRGDLLQVFMPAHHSPTDGGQILLRPGFVPAILQGDKSHPKRPFVRPQGEAFSGFASVRQGCVDAAHAFGDRLVERKSDPLCSTEIVGFLQSEIKIAPDGLTSSVGGCAGAVGLDSSRAVILDGNPGSLPGGGGENREGGPFATRPVSVAILPDVRVFDRHPMPVGEQAPEWIGFGTGNNVLQNLFFARGRLGGADKVNGCRHGGNV